MGAANYFIKLRTQLIRKHHFWGNKFDKPSFIVTACRELPRCSIPIMLTHRKCDLHLCKFSLEITRSRKQIQVSSAIRESQLGLASKIACPTRETRMEFSFSIEARMISAFLSRANTPFLLGLHFTATQKSPIVRRLCFFPTPGIQHTLASSCAVGLACSKIMRHVLDVQRPETSWRCSAIRIRRVRR